MKKSNKKPIVNTHNYQPGEPLTDFGGAHPRKDSIGNPLPENLTESFKRCFDAKITDPNFEVIYSGGVAKITDLNRGTVSTIKNETKD